MTTNHLERLDPALVRPGRVDVMHSIGPASPSQLRRMFLKFFPAQDEHAERFVANLAACQLSMALLQSYFMLYRDSAEQVTLALALAQTLALALTLAAELALTNLLTNLTYLLMINCLRRAPRPPSSRCDCRALSRRSRFG